MQRWPKGLAVGLDPPRQLRMRRLLMPAFSKPVVERARVFARRAIAEVLDRPAGEPFDFVADVARIVPARVILFLTGLSEKYLANLPHWSASVIAGLAGGANTPDVLDETERTFKVMEVALREEIEQRRTRPQEDFLSTLLAAEFQGDRLSDDEVISTCIMTLLAGNDTTANTLGLSAVALAHNPDAWRYARQHPAGMPDFVMEMMRYVAMSTAQSRMVAQDFEWQGQQLRCGDLVYLVIAGANRDPKKFSDPERLDAERPQDGNLTFGPGLHMCIGHLVAKMQLEEFFTALFARFGGIEVLDSTLDWHSSLAFRGLRSLNARLLANS
jgi:pimeloyl-[acyl-carrier protein] synthase